MAASNESTSYSPTADPAGLSEASPRMTPNGPTAGSSAAVERVVRGAHETIDRFAEMAVPRVQQWQDSVQHSAEHAREIGEEWTESVRTTVREHPVASVLAALAVGMLIARLTAPPR